jgi:hypothetical protein
MGSYMPISIKLFAAGGCLGAMLLASAACSPRRIPPMTVTDLMEDRVVLDGVLMKCNQNPSKARTDTDCLNARIAIDRIAASRSDPAEEEKRMAEFERSREQLRSTQEKLRREQEAKTKVDAYHLPLVPVEPQASPPPPSGSTSPPVVRESNP